MSKSYLPKKSDKFWGHSLFDLIVLQNLWALPSSWSQLQIVKTDEMHSNRLRWSLSTNILTIEFLEEFLTLKERVSHFSGVRRTQKAEQDEPCLILSVFCVAITQQGFTAKEMDKSAVACVASDWLSTECML